MSLNIKEQKSIAGLRVNAVAFLSCISFFMILGIFFNILVLILEPNNKFVRNYAKQTLALSVVLVVATSINIIVVIGNLVYIILLLALSFLQIISAICAALGREFKIPYIDKIMDLLFVD